MSATAFQAMLHAGQFSGTGEMELKKHLTSHLGKGFCPTRQSVDMLADGHDTVHYSSLEFTYKGKRKQNLLSGRRRILMMRLRCTYSVNSRENQSAHLMLSGFKW
jgi:hypothetical protein